MKPRANVFAVGLALAALAWPRDARAEDGPSVSALSEVSAYTDTDHTQVLTPALQATVEDAAAGWGVTGSFLVDVVTTASADIVATASPNWIELRYAPSLSAHDKVGDADVSVHASLSHEPDYLSIAGGASVSIDLASKMVTPSLGYSLSIDTVGRADTPFSVFSHTVAHHAIDAGVGLVLDKATMLILSGSAIVELGDSSKPYRAVPMFEADVIDQVKKGMDVSEVNRLRTSDRPLEQLPTDRERWALEARLLHRFPRSTVRVGERVYTDSWGVWATTTDGQWFFDLGDYVRLGPHLRFHAQTGATFWQLAYLATPTSEGMRLPALRTGDRELGPLVSPTAGLGTRVALGASGWALSLKADAQYTLFLDHLFIQNRTALLATTIVETELP